MNRVIDIHTHVPPRQDWDFFLDQCKANHVVIAVTSSLGVSGWPEFPSEENVRQANDQARAFAEFAKGMVFWFAYINPNHPSWETELDRCMGMGARGVKLWISSKDPDTGSLDRTEAVLAGTARRRLPVLLHTYQRTDRNQKGEISLAECAGLARRHPDVTMIAAHAGGNWRQARGLAAGLPNLFVDICGGYPETGIVESVRADIGTGRILYGSDALGRSIPSQVAKVIFAGISSSERRQILWENAVGLLHLTDSEICRAQTAFNARAGSKEYLPLPPLDEDHFCYTGTCCYRENPAGTPAELNDALAQAGIRRAHAAGADTFYCYDVMAANERLAQTAAGCPNIHALATLLPFAYNRDVILNTALSQGFSGGIVFPYLQDWRLDDPAFMPFFSACADLGMPLWINCCTADIRFRPRGTVCRDVSPTELVSFLKQAPPNRYVFQGVTVTGVRNALKERPGDDIAFEISRLSDNSSALIGIVREFGIEHLVLGTEFPFRDLRTVPYTARRLCGHDTMVPHEKTTD